MKAVVALVTLAASMVTRDGVVYTAQPAAPLERHELVIHDFLQHKVSRPSAWSGPARH
jgi:hypothetical protein